MACGRAQVKHLIAFHRRGFLDSSMHALQNESGGVVHVNGSGSAIGISEVIFRTERQTTVVAENTVETFNLSAKVFRAIVASNDEVRHA